MSILSRCGIPGPAQHFIFGYQVKEIEGKSLTDKQKFLIEKYGRIVGYYTGARPTILVADPVLAKLIQVEDFDNFSDRTIYMKYQHPSPMLDGAILIARGSKWRQLRRKFNPFFSSAKLKSMVPLVGESIDSFLRVVDNYSYSGQEFDCFDLYIRLSAQALISTAFGLKIDLQNEPNNEFMNAVKEYFESKVNKIVFIIFSCFPHLQPVIQLIRGFIDTLGILYCLTPIGVIYRMSSEIIAVRKQNPTFRRKDLLQSMLDSELNKEEITSNGEKTCQNEVRDGTETISLTELEIKANCVTFLGAGYETTSTSLAYVTHFLVNFPEIQERVRREAQELYERDGNLGYNSVTELKYMEWVFNEAMRMYPPVITGSTRECLNDYQYNDMVIPKGSIVTIATHYLHHDPQLWSDPELFDPMRFSSERRHEIQPSSWQPFGDGPRNCIGYKFAYLVMKLTMAKLLLEYRLVISSNTEIGNLTTKNKLVTNTPKNGVFIKVIKL